MIEKKKLFLLIFFFLFLFLKTIHSNEFSSSKNIVSYNDLIKIKNIYYSKYTNKLYTGKIEGLIEGFFLDGKRHGEFFKYYNDGKILSKINYFDNKLNGIWLEFYRNGNILIKKNYKNNKLEGEYIDYYSFGQK